MVRKLKSFARRKLLEFLWGSHAKHPPVPAPAKPIPLVQHCDSLAAKYVGREHVCEFSGVRFLVERVERKKSGAAVLVGRMPGGDEFQCCLKR